MGSVTSRTVARHAITLLVAGCLAGGAAAQRGPAGPPPPESQPDPFVARPRVVVLTDIANEPDDQMSLVRFLLYSNQFDVEGLVAGTSTWMKARVRPDVIRAVLDAYEKVQPNLSRHAAGFPTAAALREVVAAGQPGYGMAAVGPDKASPGADLVLRAAERADARPLWVLAWGGTNTLAQALVTARATRTPEQVAALVSKLRVYAISDQDDAGPWLRREFPGLRYVATPSTQDGEQYYFATWTGISGDRFYRNAPGADFSTFTDEWVNANIRSRKPLGDLYPYPCCIHEGDTPSFLGLVDNGLASAMSPAYGGWGGRYVWRQPYGETRPFWTQGGDSYPGNDSSRDTVTGADGRTYTSDQATIWRWRSAFQHDFAARIDWTVKDVATANHNPRVVVNGRAGTEPLVLDAQVGVPVTLDATGTSDPDGNALTFTWFFYPEAGSGIPGQPVLVRRRPPAEAGAPGQGGIPSAPAGGPREPPPRVDVENANAPRATVVPRAEGIAHVILAVEDNGTPSLTSYRRVILDMRPGPFGAALPPPVELTAEQDHARLMGLLGIASLRPGADPRNKDAPNAVNYDEARAGPAGKLPDPLVLKNGRKVTSAKAWWEKRRPEIVEDFDREVYGRVPRVTPTVTWEVTATTRETVGGIPAVTKSLLGHADNSQYPAIRVDVELSLTTPATATGPVPVMIEFGFRFPPGAPRPSRPSGAAAEGPSWQEQLLSKGWGYAILYPNTVQADNGAGLTAGIVGLVNKGQPRKADDWGALRAWAWGASRALDYLETDHDVDAKQVGIEGLSRYGKAALVTMAYDPRFAIAFVASSGAGGAKLYRRTYGELVENLAGSGEYHWMAGNFIKYAGPLTANDLPVDSHELIALCAPRPVFISSGSFEVEGGWVDAKGMFLAAVAAGPVYRLLGKADLGATGFPPIETALVDGDIAFRQHRGGHTAWPNWPTFLAFAGRYVKAPPLKTPPAAARRGVAGAERWVGTWAASPQLTEDANLPPAPGFADTTLRQIVHVSIGGRTLRVRFSNAFGRSALPLVSARLARAAGGGAIQASTDRALTFGGRSSIAVPAGALIVSDPLDFDLPPLSDLAITVHVRGAPSEVTGHPGSRTTSFLQAGDAVSSSDLGSAVRVDHWYFVSGVDVVADRGTSAVAVLGDSITDGRGSTTNGNDRWPDNLARRLQSANRTEPVAVLNHGLGGNRLLRDGVGPNALARLDRDVLAQPGVRWLVVVEGINDLGTASDARAKGEPAATADDIILAYAQIVERAHARHILVYGATVMPFEGFSYLSYHTPESEADRQRVNDWIRTSGRFDGVIDFDAVARDPERPTRLSAAVDGGDHLHPSAAGYRIMADAVDLSLFATSPGGR